jgi:hypothetical protein
MHEVSCYIVRISRKFMLLEQQGKMVKILVTYIPSKYWDLLTLSQDPEDQDLKINAVETKNLARKV